MTLKKRDTTALISLWVINTEAARYIFYSWFTVKVQAIMLA